MQCSVEKEVGSSECFGRMVACESEGQRCKHASAPESARDHDRSQVPRMLVAFDQSKQGRLVDVRQESKV